MKEVIKEIVSDLNLPKQILDKTSSLLNRICGPSLDEFVQMWADKVRYKRLKNQIKIFSRTVDLLETANLEPKEIKLKNLVPLIESCSLEEDENLQDKWSNLIANLSTSKQEGFENKVIKTLSNINSLEAKILDYLYSELIKTNKRRNENSLFKSSPRKPIETVEFNHFWIDKVNKEFKVDSITLRVAIENLSTLGLIVKAEPEVEIESDEKSYNVELDKVTKKQIVKVELDVEAEVSNSKYFYLTKYAVYFIEYCKFDKKQKSDT